jgi:hypothetical protein
VDEQRDRNTETAVYPGGSDQATTPNTGPSGDRAEVKPRMIDPSKLKTTSAVSYLLIARYNRSKYNALGPIRQHEAFLAANKLFPAYGNAVALEPAGGDARPQQEQARATKRDEGWILARSFHTQLHDVIKADLAHKDNASRVQADIVSETVAREAAIGSFPHLPTGDPDPGIGWVLVVSREGYERLWSERQFGENGALWHMYDIEVIPLHGDQTTDDIYQLMTPVSWQK